MYFKLIISLCFLSSFTFAEKITVAGINFESPKNWESSEPSNNMQKLSSVQVALPEKRPRWSSIILVQEIPGGNSGQCGQMDEAVRRSTG